VGYPKYECKILDFHSHTPLSRGPELVDPSDLTDEDQRLWPTAGDESAARESGRGDSENVLALLRYDADRNAISNVFEETRSPSSSAS